MIQGATNLRFESKTTPTADKGRQMNRVERLIEQLAKAIENAQALLQELQAAEQGGNPTKDTIAAWVDAWARLYGIRYELSKAEAKNLKTLVTKLGPDVVKARLLAYLADRDDFLLRQKHPLSLFWNRVNTYGASTVRLRGAVAGCLHDPRCVDDVMHTRLTVKAMRGES